MGTGNVHRRGLGTVLTASNCFFSSWGQGEGTHGREEGGGLCQMSLCQNDIY